MSPSSDVQRRGVGSARHCRLAVLCLVLWPALIGGPCLALEEDEPTAEELGAEYVGTWKLTSFWVNEGQKLSDLPGEGCGSFQGTAVFTQRNAQLVVRVHGQAPDAPAWEKELVLLPGRRQLSIDPRTIRRRDPGTQYVRCQLVLSPDGQTLRGVVNWTNGLTANRSNEQLLLRSERPTGVYPWGNGWSAWLLTRENQETTDDDKPAEPAPTERPRLLLETRDVDRLAEAAHLKETADDLAGWLSALGYDVVRELGDGPVAYRATVEIAPLKPTITGQEFYFDTQTNQAVRFLKGAIPLGAAFTLRDSGGKRTLLNIVVQRSRESTAPEGDPVTRTTPQGPIILPATMTADLQRLMRALTGQVVAFPPKQKRSPYASRLEELLAQDD